MLSIKKRWLLVLLFLVSFIPGVQAQNSSYEELQAAYLYNFAKYIEWPEEANEFIIGVYGEDTTFLKVLENVVKNKKVNGKEIQLKKVLSPEEAITSHMVYFPDKESRNIGPTAREITGKNVLIVTEKDQIKKGAAISFVIEHDRLRFRLKKTSLSEAGLVATDGLLRLAIVL